MLFQKGFGDSPEGVGLANAVCFPLDRDLDRGVEAALGQGDPISGGGTGLLRASTTLAAILIGIYVVAVWAMGGKPS